MQSIADDGEVIVVSRRTRRLIGTMVTDADEPIETWRMRFSSSGTLRTLEEVEDGGEQSISFAPYVTPDRGGGGTVRLAKEWPKFPLRPGEDTQRPDHSLAQHVEEHEQLLRVTMIARGSDDGDTIERTVVQEWERDRPWWSSVTIRKKVTYSEKTYDDFVLEGHVTAWRLREAE